MPWTEVSIRVCNTASEAVEAVLEQFGALSVTLEDDEDHPVLEPAPGATPLWPSLRIRGLFEAGADRRKIQAALGAVTGSDRPDRIRWRAIEDRDWERVWLDRFEPMQFGEHLWVVPGGMGIPADPDYVEIHLDPGLAFGTGTHPTTALCLEWLDGWDVTSLTVVDFGCGSGILGIAAALKGAARVICVDIDPQALEATRENARRNDVSGHIECMEAKCLERQAADIVLANILAMPLVELAPDLLRTLRPGGALVLSGILEEQAGMVRDAYREHLTAMEARTKSGWVRMEGRKR